MVFRTSLYHDGVSGSEHFHRVKSIFGEHELKLLLSRYYENSSTKVCQIMKDDAGKPSGLVLENGQAIIHAVSLSHCYPYIYAVAAKDARSIGCDIERARSYTQTFCNAFLSSHEYHYASRNPRGFAYGVTLAWALKESILKALGVGIRLHPRKVDVHMILENEGLGSYMITIDEKPVECRVEKILYLEGYIATVVSLE